MRTVGEGDPDGKGRADGPMVLPRVFSLLRLLADNRRGLTLSELATRTSVPKSSLSSTLKTLHEQGLLTREGWTYSLGPEAFALASVILAGRTLSQIAHPTLVETMEQCGETVLLAALDRDSDYSVYIDIVETANAVRYSVPVGTRRPLYPTAAGRVILAYQTPEQLRAYFKRVRLEKCTDRTVVDRREIERLLEEIRRTGLATNSGEFSPDSSAFAAPVLNSSGALVAALTIALPTSRVEAKRAALEQQTQDAAARLSKVIGHHSVRDAGPGF